METSWIFHEYVGRSGHKRSIKPVPLLTSYSPNLFFCRSAFVPSNHSGIDPIAFSLAQHYFGKKYVVMKFNQWRALPTQLKFRKTKGSLPDIWSIWEAAGTNQWYPFQARFFRMLIISIRKKRATTKFTSMDFKRWYFENYPSHLNIEDKGFQI